MRWRRAICAETGAPARLPRDPGRAHRFDATGKRI